MADLTVISLGIESKQAEVAANRMLALGGSIVTLLGAQGPTALRLFTKFLQGVAYEVAFIQDTVELLWAAFIGGIKAAELGILGPLKSALDFFGVQIDGLNNKVASLLEDLTEVGNRLGQGPKNINEVRAAINCIF